MRLLTLLALFAATTPSLALDVIYVSVAGEKRIAVYHVGADGRLTHASNTATTGEPGALIADPKRQYLFAALRSTGELAAFRIDAGTGKLTHLNTVPAGADPAHITVDATGKYLLTAYYVAGQVTVHDIAADGKLVAKPRQTVKTKEKAHAVVFSNFAFTVMVPHTGPNVIYHLRWDGREGKLEPLNAKNKDKFTVETPKNTGPRHAVYHPTLNINDGFETSSHIAYVVNEQGNSVTVYRDVWGCFLDCYLDAQQTVSTLPPEFKGTNACAEIRLHPSNQFLYVSNRGHDSIAGFRIDLKTGRLTGLGQTPTEKTPRSFDLDPSGKYLYAAGKSSGKLAAYRVNEETGALERTASYEVGKTPWWVQAVRLPGN